MELALQQIRLDLPGAKPRPLNPTCARNAQTARLAHLIGCNNLCQWDLLGPKRRRLLVSSQAS